MMADPTCRNHNRPGQRIDSRKRLVTSRANGNRTRCRDGDLIMKRTMAAVIVGPSIEPSASVFASERARYGTAAKGNWRATEAVKANMAEQGYDLCPVKAERGCFEVK